MRRNVYRFVLIVAYAASVKTFAQVSNCPFNVLMPSRGGVSDALVLSRQARATDATQLLGGTGVPTSSYDVIQAQIQGLQSRLDLDGDGMITTYDSAVASRILLGYTTAAAVTGLTPAASGIRNTSVLVKTFLDSGCPAPSGFVITSASLASGVLTVSGNGFGTRTQAAPLRFEDFESRSVGALPQNFGYSGWSPDIVKVDSSTSFSGTRSLKHQGPHGPASTGGVPAESFPHVAVEQFQSDELYLSYRLKFRTNGNQFAQLKFNRSGMDNNDGSGCYQGKPRFFSSYYPAGDRYSTDKRLNAVQGGAVNGNNQWDEGWVGDAHMGNGTVLPIAEDTWVQVEEYYRLNDIGIANGVHMTWVNGNPQIIRSNLQPRTATEQKFNCSYLVIGMDYWINEGSTQSVSVWYDDHYLDTSRARLVLANANTWSAATHRSPQPATAWSNASITAPLRRAGFAAGSAWLYVVRHDGTVSAPWQITLP
jgi:hypothetical protein